MKDALFAALAVVSGGFAAVWMAALVRPAGSSQKPDWRDAGVGFVTNVFDTLGIGSFATTSAFFKLWGTVPDERIPGTLVVGHTPPSLRNSSTGFRPTLCRNCRGNCRGSLPHSPHPPWNRKFHQLVRRRTARRTPSAAP